MNQIISACGLSCGACDYLKTRCPGCHAAGGETFWAKDSMPDGMCPLYKCSVIEKKYHSCGQCAELPCQKFVDLKDPAISEEQHKQSIQERVLRLKGPS